MLWDLLESELDESHEEFGCVGVAGISPRVGIAFSFRSSLFEGGVPMDDDVVSS